MAFPPQFLDELRARLPLSDIVGKRLRLVRAGREYKAPCPFHNEKTPSFYINDQKGFFHCFGCGAHGDVINFTMRHDNLAFPDAVEVLAGEAGLPVPRATPEERQKFERQKSLYDLVEAATRWFERQLHEPGGRAARDYLTGRGLDDATIARFRLGFAPADRSLLRVHLAREGYKEPEMVEAGLLREPEDGGPAYSFFRNRVLFPVADRRGRIVAFGGRILEGLEPASAKAGGPKYINSADNPLFHKGRLLYNMSRARQVAADGGKLIVVEGYMDVIALVRAGFEGAVAPLGTALTESQILELWKLAPAGNRVPVLCFDGDNAGQRAAFRAADRILPLLQPDHSVQVAFMQGGDDPDSLIRRAGPRAMDEVLARARPLADVLWGMALEGRTLTTPEAKAGLKAALEEQVLRIADKTVQETYRLEMRRRFDDAYGWRSQRAPAFAGRAAGGRQGMQPRKGGRDRNGGNGGGRNGTWRDETTPIQPPPPPPPLAAEKRERFLMAILINHPDLFEEIAETLMSVTFVTEPLDTLRDAVVAALSRTPGLDANSLAVHLREHGSLETSEVLENILSEATYDHAPFARPEASLDQAQRAWRDILGGAYHGTIAREAWGAGDEFKQDVSDAAFARLLALTAEAGRRTAEISQALDDDPDPEFGG